jgi:hypothetical protein
MSLKSGGIRGGQLYALSHSLIYISNMGYRRILGVNVAIVKNTMERKFNRGNGKM